MITDPIRIAQTAWLIHEQKWVEDPQIILDMAKGYGAFQNELRKVTFQSQSLRDETLYVRQCWERFCTLFPEEEATFSSINDDASFIPDPFQQPLKETQWTLRTFSTPRVEAEYAAHQIHTWLHQGILPENMTIMMMDQGLTRWVQQALLKHQIAWHTHPSPCIRDTITGSWIERWIALIREPSVLNLLSMLKHPLSQWGYDPPTLHTLLEQWEHQVLRSADSSPPHFESLIQSYNPDHPQGIELILKHLHTCLIRLKTCTSLNEVHNLIVGILDTAAYYGSNTASNHIWHIYRDKLTALVDDMDLKAYSLTFYSVLMHLTLDTLCEQNAHGVALSHASATSSPRTDKMILVGCHEQGWPHSPSSSVGDHIHNTLRLIGGMLPMNAHQEIGFWGKNASEIICTRSRDAQGRIGLPAPWWIKMIQKQGEQKHPAPMTEAPAMITAHNHTSRRPEPCPPLEVRPRKISVSAFETCLRDPYSFYARWILKLKEPVSLRGHPTRLSRGMIIHALMHTLAQHWPDLNPHKILSMMNRDVARMVTDPLERLWLEPKLKEWTEAWMHDIHTMTGDTIHSLLSEHPGSWSYQTTQGPFTLTTRADRLDVFHDGSLRIIDYKTGVTPSVQALRDGRAPQMILEGMVALHGGFVFQKALSTLGMIRSLALWTLKDPSSTFDKTTLDTDLLLLIEQVENTLKKWIITYENPDQPYHAEALLNQYDPYRTLKRVEEWTAPVS